MKKVKLAEALLRRKELAMKVAQLQQINHASLFETVVKRMKVSDQIDQVEAQVAKLSAADVTREYDHYSKALRLCDAVVQNANWTTDVSLDDAVMADFEAPKPARATSRVRAKRAVEPKF